jgi:hypothetical protein
LDGGAVDWRAQRWVCLDISFGRRGIYSLVRLFGSGLFSHIDYMVHPSSRVKRGLLETEHQHCHRPAPGGSGDVFYSCDLVYVVV